MLVHNVSISINVRLDILLQPKNHATDLALSHKSEDFEMDKSKMVVLWNRPVARAQVSNVQGYCIYR